MADYGLTVVNGSAQTQIDSTYRNYSLVKQDFAYSKSTGDWPYMIGTFPEQTLAPIITFRPPYHTPTALVAVTATQCHFLATKGLREHVEYQVWQRGIVTPATWGMNVYNASGDAVFSSEDHHFVITNVMTGTYNPIQSGAGEQGVPFALASANKDFIVTNKGGVQEQIGDGTPVLQRFVYRGYAWGNWAGKNQFTGHKRDVIPDAVWAQNGETNDTFQATALVIGVKSIKTGKYRQLFSEKRLSGGFPDYYRGVVVADRHLESTKLIYGDSAGYLRVGAGNPTSTEGTNLGNVTGVAHCTSTILLAVQNPHPLDSRISHIYRSAGGGAWAKSDLTGQVKEHYLTCIEGVSATAALAGSRRYSGVGGGNATPGIWRSNDMGQNWSLIATYDNGAAYGLGIYWITKEASSVFWAGCLPGLLPPRKSNDSGNTWNKVGVASVGNINVNPVNGSILLGVTAGVTIARSTNGGQTWTNIVSLAARTSRTQTDAIVGFLDATYAMAITKPNGQFWRSDDVGLTFDTMVGEFSYTATSYFIDQGTSIIRFPNNISATDLVYFVGGNGGVWRNYEQYQSK